MNRSNFSLYAKPSFIEGVARLMDLCGVLNVYNTSKTSQEADYRAMLADWESLGQDFHAVIEKIKKNDLNCIEHG